MAKTEMPPRKRSRVIRRALATAGLIGPALLLMLAVFVTSLFLLFSYSVFRFTGITIDRTFTLQAYVKFFTDPFFARVLGTGFKLAATTTFVCLAVGYPTAYAMSRIKSQKILLLAYAVVFSPLLVSVVVRSYGWLLILSSTGLVNYVLQQLQLIEQPARLIFNFTGVAIGFSHVLLPFAVFPILSVLVQLDPTLKEVAADLGANRLRTFLSVTLPLSLPGILSAFQLCLVLSMSAYVSPRLLGGGRVLVLPVMIYENIIDRNWPLASVQSMVLLVVVLMVIIVSNWISRKVYRLVEA